MWETVLGSHGRGGLSFRDNYTSTVKTFTSSRYSRHYSNRQYQSRFRILKELIGQHESALKKFGIC